MEKYTLHKIYHKWHFSTFTMMDLSSLSSSRTFHPSKSHSIPLSSHSLFSNSSPWQPLICFMPTWICSLWIFHEWNYTICDILWPASFPWHSVLRFIHVVAGSVLHPFSMTELYWFVCIYTTSCLFIHQLAEIWIVSTFWAIVNSAAMNIGIRYLFESLFSTSGVYS